MALIPLQASLTSMRCASDAAPDYLVLPKTESAGHLQILDRLLTTAKRPTRLVGLVESNRRLAAVEAIAGATPRLAALMLGAADMAADLRAATAWAPLAYVRSRLVLACARGRWLDRLTLFRCA
jgi:(S)-citramalyl-CoA lyase